MPDSWYRYDPDHGRLTLAVQVQAGASRTEVAGLHGGRLKVRVAASAIDGKANAMLVGFLAHKFDLPGGRVMIRRGSHGRTKTIEIYGHEDSILARVKALLPS